jgi:hypothetical protein
MNYNLPGNTTPFLPVTGRFSSEDIADELAIIEKTTLKDKPALKKLLNYVTSSTLQLKAKELKEYTIATLVFGKSEHFDPRMSSLVRTQASKLRAALVTHYKCYPHEKGPWIWIPPGSYSAVFDHNPRRTAAMSGPHPKSMHRDSFLDSRIGDSPNAPPGTFNLRNLARVTVKLQQERFVERLGSAFASAVSGIGPEEVGVISPNIRIRITVGQTILEREDQLIFTAYLAAGPKCSILFENSFSISCTKDLALVVAKVDPLITAFVSSCALLVESHWFDAHEFDPGRQQQRWVAVAPDRSGAGKSTILANSPERVELLSEAISH